MTLVDTSAWVAFLRGDGSPADQALARLLADHARLFVTDLVAAELLAGAPDEETANQIQKLVLSLDRSAPPGPMDVERAAHLFRVCRAAGTPLRSLTSALVAVVALRDGHEVLAAHPDFDILRHHAEIRLQGSTETSTDTPLRPAADGPSQILIIEDEPSTSRLLEGALAGPDRIITVVTTGRDARNRLADHTPDAIILDLILPDEDGRTLLPDLRMDPRTRDVGVVVVTGRAGPRTREECYALGADAFFEKPFDSDALATAVETLLKEGRSSAPTPDPLHVPLTLAEVQKLLTLGRTEPDPADAWTVGVFEIDTACAPGVPLGERDVPTPDSPPLLPALLRTAIDALQRRLHPGELLARWGVHQLVVVSPSRSPQELGELLSDLAGSPRLHPCSSALVRPVHQGEDLLDAVSNAASAALQRLPPAGTGAAVSGADTPPPSARPRVVLVEDDPITAGLVRHRLTRSGFEVDHHSDGARGLAAILQTPPSVVILDVQLPSMDGFEILGRLRESPRTSALPILMFTSLGRQEHVQRGFELGADDYVTKPFSPSELLTRVLRLVRRR